MTKATTEEWELSVRTMVPCVIPCTNRGGTELATLRMMELLSCRGFDFHWLSLRPIGSLNPQLSAATIRVNDFPYRGPYGIFSLFAILRVLRQVDSPVVWMISGSVTGLLVSMCSGKKIVLSMHGCHYGVRAKGFWKIFYYLVSPFLRAVTFPSLYTCREAISLCPWIKDKAHIINNPLYSGESQYPAEKNTDRKNLSGKFIVGIASRMSPGKRFDVAFSVMQQCVMAGYDVHIRVAGDGPEKTAIMQECVSRGLREQVDFLGEISDMTGFYASLDVLLFCSDHESYGNVVLEAMSHAVPVIASCLRGGTKELIVHGIDGYFYEKHDVNAMAKAIISLINDGDHRQLMSQSAFQRALTLIHDQSGQKKMSYYFRNQSAHRKVTERVVGK